MPAPGTSEYWIKCRDEIWLLHGEGLSQEDIVGRTGCTIYAVRAALSDLSSEVRRRRSALIEAEKNARAACREQQRLERGEAALGKREAMRVLRKALAEKRRLEKLARAKPTIEDQIMTHWANGRDTYDISRILNRGEPYVVGVLVARREAARREAARAAARGAA